MPHTPHELALALANAWQEVESGEAARVAAGVEVFRSLVAQAIGQHGDESEEYCSALRGLAVGLAALGRYEESRAFAEVLAEVEERRYAALGGVSGLTEQDADARVSQLTRVLDAHARSLTVGAAPEDVDRILPKLDALLARSERELGLTAAATLRLLEQRAELLLRSRPDEGLVAYDLLIARAAAGTEPANQLTALAEKAVALSRLDRDEESALLWSTVLDGRRALLGHDAPDTLVAWGWFSRTLAWSGEGDRAISEFSSLIPALERVYGDAAELTRKALRFQLRLLLDSRGDDGGDAGDGDRRTDATERALELQRALVAREETSFGAADRTPLASRAASVALLIELGRWEEAVETAAAVQDAAERALGRDDPLLIEIGISRHRALAGLANEIDDAADEGDSGRADAVRRTGRALADELGELAVHQLELAARSGVDPVDLVATLALILRLPASWWEPGGDEHTEALARSAERLAQLAATEEFTGLAALMSAEGAARVRLGVAYFDTESMDAALEQFDRARELAKRAAELGSGGVAPAGGDADAQHDAAKLVAVTLRRLGRSDEAAAVANAAIGAAQQGNAAPELIGGLRNVRALALQDLRRFDEAAEDLRALWEQNGDPGRALDYSVVLLNADRPAEAESLLRPVLALLEAGGHAHTPTALGIVGNLARAACGQGRHAEAAIAFDGLLERQRVALGDTDRNLFITLHNRALEADHLDDVAEAVLRFEEVVRLRSEHLGERDPQTLSSLAELARVSERAGDVPRAHETLERAAELAQQVLGPTHPTTLRRRGELRALRERVGAGGEAASGSDASTELSELSEQLSAGGDPQLRLRYAEALLDQDRPGDALIEYVRARDALMPSGGLPLLAAERGIAETHRRMGNDREAAEAFGRVIPQLELLLPQDRWALANALNAQSAALAKLPGRADEMVSAGRRALVVADRAASDVDRSVWLRLWFGRRLRALDRAAAESPKLLQDALALHQEAAQLAEAELGKEHRTTLEAADDLAEAYADLGRHRDALMVYRSNLPAMVKVLGSGSKPVARAKQRQAVSVAKANGRLQSVIGAVVILGIVAWVVWSEYGDQLRQGEYGLILALGIACVLGVAVVLLVLRLRGHRRRGAATVNRQ